jgi:hypothetical protein
MAQFIADVRAEVVDRHDPNLLGDTVRGLGFRAYECCRNRIIKAAAHGAMPWLSIMTAEHRFTFGINGVPIRFYRGSPTSPEERRLQSSIEARQQMSLLPVDASSATLLWFFVIEIDENKYTDRVVFCAFCEETREQVCYWEVPLRSKVTSVPVEVTPKASPVKKRAVVLSVKKPDIGKEREIKRKNE